MLEKAREIDGRIDGRVDPGRLRRRAAESYDKPRDMKVHGYLTLFRRKRFLSHRPLISFWRCQGKVALALDVPFWNPRDVSWSD